MNKKVVFYIALVIGLLLSVYELVAWRAERYKELPVIPPQTLVRRTVSGGNCLPEVPVGYCYPRVDILMDGTVLLYGIGEQAALSEVELSELKDMIDGTSFKDLTRKEFFGECPINLDGNVYTYIFVNSVGEAVEIYGCEIAIDHKAPIYRLVNSIISDHVLFYGEL